MSTIKDVADLAGVSTATVSNFINKTKKVSPDTRFRIERAIAELDYVPNSAGRALALRKFGSKNDGTDSKDVFAQIDESNEIKKTNPADFETNFITRLSETTNVTRTARVLMRLIRAAQPISRIEIAKRMNVNRSTVTTIIKPLIDADIIREGELQTSSIGRPRVGLSFNSEKDFFVGVNIGVRGIQVGVTTPGGDVIAEEEFITPPDAEKALSDLRMSIERLCAKAVGRKLKVIGVCVPGPTDAERSKLLYAPHLGWRDVEIAEALKFNSGGNKLFVPVIVENDATAAALYEARLRLGKSSDASFNNFILIRSGTGIGVGLVIGGEVYRGTDESKGIAGEFGHMTIVAGGKVCACGNRGCWERYASASAAASLYLGDRPQFGVAKPRYIEIVSRAEAGELRAKRTLEHMGEYLGIGIGNVITGLGVPHVILSGRIVYGWKFIKEPLFKAVSQSMVGKLSDWSVEPGEPRGAGLGGALEVAVEEFLTTSLNTTIS